MSACLADLVNVRSQLAEDLARYYESVIEALDTTRWFRNNDFIKTSDIAIPVRVLKEDTRPRPEREGREPGGREPRDRDGSREDRSRDYIDPEIARLYEAPTHEKRTVEVAWDSERSNIKRALILGAPGGGKSFLTQRLAVEIAKTALDDLNAQRRPIDTLPAPIHVECGELGKADLNADLAGGLIDMLRANTDRYETTPRLLEWLRPRLATNHVWLILDALDQIADDRDKQNFLSWLKAFQTQRWQSPVVVTCRTANYDRAEIPWIQCAEYELAPFRPQEIKTFIEHWFGKGDDKGKALAPVLEHSYSLSHACGTPIVLTLTCLAHEEQAVTENTRRVDLYNTVLRGLVRRAWKTNPLPKLPKAQKHLSHMLIFLEGLARPLFEASPRANWFTDTAVMTAIGSIENHPLPWRLRTLLDEGKFETGLMQHVPDLLVDELFEAGILVYGGLSRDDEVQWSFLHRSFVEYLTAGALAREVKINGWPAVEGFVSRMVWLPEWQEVIVLLAGLLDEPGPLLEMLGEPEPNPVNPHGDDYFRHRLILACIAIGEIAPETQDGNAKLLDKLTVQALDRWREHSRLFMDFTTFVYDDMLFCDHGALSVVVIPARSKANWRFAHIKRVIVLRDDDNNYKFNLPAIHVLGEIASKGDEAVVSTLLAALAFWDDENAYVRSSAAKALGKLSSAGNEAVVSALLTALRDDDRESVRFYAGDALDKLASAGNEAVINALLAAFRNNDYIAVRWRVAEALGRLESAGNEVVLSTLLAALRNDDDENVRWRTAEALGRLASAGNEAVLSTLFTALRDDERAMYAGGWRKLWAGSHPRATRPC